MFHNIPHKMTAKQILNFDGNYEINVYWHNESVLP